MPQFDTFSFFSQLFWVFLSFTTFYLIMCFYILPALAITLKVRKHKLQGSNHNSSNDTNLLLPAAMTATGSSISFLQDIDTKLVWLESWIEESLISNNSNNSTANNASYAPTIISSVLTNFYKLNIFLSLQKVTIMKFAN
jgi:hypothetical protein